MTTIFTSQNLQALLSFPFKDSKWQNKLLLAALFCLAGGLIVPFMLLYGYFARIIRRVASEDGTPYLPEWDGWEELLKDGLRMWGIFFIIGLPAMCLMIAGYIGMLAPAFFSPLIGYTNNSSTAGLWMMLATLGGSVLMVIGILLTLFTGCIAQAPVIHVTVTRDFSAAFRFKEWWPIFRANLGGFVLAYICMLAITYVFFFAVQLLSMTIILCIPSFLILFAVTPYQAAVYYALFAQVYRDGKEKAAAHLQPSAA